MKKRGKTIGGGVFLNSKTLKAIRVNPSFRILSLALHDLKVKVKDPSLHAIKSDSSFHILKLALQEPKEKYDAGARDLKSLFEEKPARVMLPVSIFNNNKLSSFEIICKYLKEELGLKISEIASMTNRDHRTVWSTYSNSLKNQKSRLLVK